MALQLRALRDALLDAIESRLAVLTWMVGFNLIMTAGVLWRQLAHS
jgi:hypothetical protein